MSSKAMLAVAMAFAVAMMAVPMAAIDEVSADDTSGNTYNVSLYEGQQYSYTPTFSLSNVTVTVSGTAVSAFGMTVSGNTISGTAPQVNLNGSSDTYSLDICASTTKPVQTVHQYISFTVYDTLYVTGVTSKATFVGDSVNVHIGSNFEGNGASYSATGLPSGLSINQSTGVISGTVSGSPGTYDATVTVQHAASGQTTAAGHAKTKTVQFIVSSGVTVSSSDGTLEMYVINGYPVTTDPSDANYYKLTSNLGDEAVFSADMEAAGLTGLTMNSDGTITGTPTFMGEKSVTVTVSENDNSANSTTVTIKITAVAKLSFGSVPTGGIVATGA